MDVSAASMASQTMSVHKAQTGSDILQKTLQKTAEAQQNRPSGGGLAAMTGKGMHVNIKA